MVYVVGNYPFISYFLLFLIHASWNFHSSRCHPLLFHPYHAHELVPIPHEHAFHPYSWDSGNENKTSMEYCIDDGIRSFTPGSFPCFSDTLVDAFNSQLISIQRFIHSCVYPSTFNTKISHVLVIYDAGYRKIYLRIMNGCCYHGIIVSHVILHALSSMPFVPEMCLLVFNRPCAILGSPCLRIPAFIFLFFLLPFSFDPLRSLHFIL